MAPTVFRTRNLRIVIYPKDHEPPHVHAIGPDAEAKFEIETLNCFFSRGFTTKDLKRIQSYLDSQKEYLMEVWNDNQKD